MNIFTKSQMKVIKEMFYEYEKGWTEKTILLLLGLPIMVLKEEYWRDGTEEINDFTDKVLALLEDFQNEEFTISDVKKYLEENGIQYITKKPL